MSLWSRIANVFRNERVHSEIDEEFEAHIADAMEQGRDPEEARAAFGRRGRVREVSRDVRVIPWLDGVRSDVVFGWRQLRKRKVTSAAAILSLGLAIGACTSAFRLIDALLLRPMPVADANQLFSLARQGMGIDGKPNTFDGWAYPDFQLMRDAAGDHARLVGVSYSQALDVTYRGDAEMEKARVQYVSGSMFPVFGLRAAAGRLLTPDDDRYPGAHPYAVISYDYWSRRFGRDAGVIGRTFHLGSAYAFAGANRDSVFQIVGVADRAFTGTEPGTFTDVFLPTMMHPGATRDDWTWLRTMARIKPGVAMEPLRARLDATSRTFEENRAKGFKGMTRQAITRWIDQKLIFQGAAGGISDLQESYRRSLSALAVLVALVLLIACVNVANLLGAQAASRAREMALRVSIGAGRRRLVQLVLIESAILALLASGVGSVFAWWSAPFVVKMINPPGNPARLVLPADWRVLGFGLALTVGVTLLFGLAPALRASVMTPAAALKGGADPHSRRRLTHGLIVAQVAFCFVVLFGACLFAVTFDRLSKRPVGFEPKGLLTVETVTQEPRPTAVWDQVSNRLRQVPGVESTAISGWPLLTIQANGFVSVNGAPPGPVLAYFLTVSPGWLSTMKIPLDAGRDFRESDSNRSAIVSETFARTFFGTEDVVGKFYERGKGQFEIVGLARDTPYRSLRELPLPVAYTRFDGQATQTATLLVRTAISDPMALASTIRRDVPASSPDFRVSNVQTQLDLVRAQTVRERLLAALGMFFAALALALAGIGLYGVLDYSVLQRRREIGIRMAIGARGGEIAWRVTADVLGMVVLGGGIGFACGILSSGYVEGLLYQARPTDAAILTAPWLVIAGATLIAALPAALRAVRTDPVSSLRAD